MLNSKTTSLILMMPFNYNIKEEIRRILILILIGIFIMPLPLFLTVFTKNILTAYLASFILLAIVSYIFYLNYKNKIKKEVNEVILGASASQELIYQKLSKEDYGLNKIIKKILELKESGKMSDSEAQDLLLNIYMIRNIAIRKTIKKPKSKNSIQNSLYYISHSSLDKILYSFHDTSFHLYNASKYLRNSLVKKIDFTIFVIYTRIRLVTLFIKFNKQSRTKFLRKITENEFRDIK